MVSSGSSGSSGRGRILLPLALLAMFVVGWSAAVIVRNASAPAESTQAQEVSRLQQQVATLQARLRSREDLAAARQSRDAFSADAPGATRDRRSFADRGDRGANFAGLMPGAPVERGAATSPAVASSGDVKTALDRFYRYLEATSAPGPRGGTDGAGRASWSMS